MLRGLDILVVDDDLGCLESMEDLLTHDGHRIRTATRGADALGIAEEFRASDRRLHLSILDFHVPDMNGLETFIRLTDLLPNIGGIFVSAASTSSLERSIHEAGGVALLRKPVDLCGVRGAIEEFSARMMESWGPDDL
ncbi:MAG: response regulator [Planctomycetota bacterium]